MVREVETREPVDTQQILKLLPDYESNAPSFDKSMAIIAQQLDNYWRNPVLFTSHLGWLANHITSSRLGVGLDPDLELKINAMAHMAIMVQDKDWADSWRNPITRQNIDLKGIPTRSRLFVLSRLAYAPALHYLTQETFNFLNLADVPNAELGARSKRYTESVQSVEQMRERITNVFSVPGDEIRLTRAFVKQLYEDAEPHAKQVYTGNFVMDRVPLKRLDDEIDYDSMRLVIVPTGIFCTLVKWGFYSPFFWTASAHHRMPFCHDAYSDLALDILMAGIWRDACVVKRKFAEERTRGHYKPNHNKRISKRVILPRVVHECAWADERERTGITHSAHTVKATYRELHEGWNQGEGADLRAADYGYPAPPEGFTFVKPHKRGAGEAAPVDFKKVVCRGLLTVSTALG